MNAPPRFLCDEMLGHVCRYLRAAGYDTLFDCSGLPDRELLKLCHEQGRTFLTQDRLIIEHKAALGVAFILPVAGLDQLAAIIGEHFDINWLRHSFTRCLVDNTPLLPADDAALQRIPADAQKPSETFSYCPCCARVYWPGSHYKRMKAKLQLWQNSRTVIPK